MTKQKITDKKIKKVLEEATDFSKNIVNTVQAIILVLDKEGKIISFNPYMEKIFGYKLNEVKGKDWFTTFLPKCDYNRIKKVFRKAISDIQTIGNINPIIAKDGHEVLVEWHDKTLKNKDGKIIGIVSIGQDITQREKAKESEGRYKVLFESSRDAIMTLEPPNWMFTSGNPSTIKMFACKNEKDFISRSPWFYSPEYQPNGKPSLSEAKKSIMKAMKEGDNSFEWTHRRVTGEDFPATILLTRMTVGDKTFLQATVRDISKNKKAENALVESEEKFRNLMEFSPMSIQGYDTNGTVLHWNKASENIYGYTAEEAIGKNLGKLIIPPNIIPLYKKVLQLGRKTKKSGEFLPAGEVRLLKKDGSSVNVYSTHTLIKIKNREPEMFCIDIDLSERKKAEEELKKRSYELKERLKELHALFGLSELASKTTIELDGILQKAVNLLPPAWQYSDIACARIILKNKEFKTKNFKATKWKQTAYIKINRKKVGIVEVRYLKKKPSIDEGPFLKEERNLINALSKQIESICERKKNQEIIKESELRYRTLTESSPDCIKLIDTKGHIIFINQGGLNEHKLKSLEDAKKKKWKPINTLIKKDQPKFQKAFQNALNGKTTTILLKHTKKGACRSICFETMVPVRDTNNNIVSIFVVSRDFSAQKKLEEDIIKSHKELEERVEERTAELKKAKDELQEKVHALERFSNLAVGRELKMIELKEKIKELEKNQK